MTVSPLPLENVADYPRPPRLEAVTNRITIDFAGIRIADTTGAYRVLETFHPPTYYLPAAAFVTGALVPARGRSLCEWKGQASYFDVVSGNSRAERAAWTYRDPTPDFVDLAEMIAVYPARMDRCAVDGIAVIPQPGDFYGGWATPNITGPIKGAPGTTHW